MTIENSDPLTSIIRLRCSTGNLNDKLMNIRHLNHSLNTEVGGHG